MAHSAHLRHSLKNFWQTFLAVLCLGACQIVATQAEVPAERTVDVLVVYTPSVKIKLNGEDGVRAEINSMIAATNNAFGTSDVQAKLVLVGTSEVAYSESQATTNSYNNDLVALRTGAIPGVHALRESAAADLVCLLREGTGTDANGNKNTAGLAYLLETLSGQSDLAFSVVGRGQSPHNFAHEIGHNLGCGHALGDPNNGGLFPYSHGYVYRTTSWLFSNESFGTIMSYSGTPRLRYSNPRLSTDEGWVTSGYVATGNASTADNARTINQTVEVVAAYRAAERVVENPLISTDRLPESDGLYWEPVTITLKTATPNAEIAYALDDSTTSTKYTEPFVISKPGTTLVRARAFRDGFTASATVSKTIKMPEKSNETVSISYIGDLSGANGNNRTYNGPATIHLTAPNSGVIRYTLDGSDVTENSPIYETPLYLPRNVTLKARIYRPGYMPGEQIVRIYTINKISALAPVLSPNGGIYANSVTISLKTDTPSARIVYNTEESSLWYVSSGTKTLTQSTLFSAYTSHEDYYSSVPVSARFTILSNNEVLARYGNTSAAGEDHSLFISSSAVLFGTGGNASGQLGTGDTENHVSPVQIATGVSNVAAGNDYTLYTTNNLALYATGKNDAGQLGTGDTIDRQAPAHVADNVLLLAAGQSHSLFTTTENSLYVFGSNENGQLGTGDEVARHSPAHVADNVLLVAAGALHSVYVTGDGTLWGMGYNGFGQLGDGTAQDRNMPVEIATGVVAVAAGAYHTLFLKSDGTAWAMGFNGYGQLGDGTTQYHYVPVQIAENVKAIAAGNFFSLLLKEDGTVWGFGANDGGQLGVSTFGAPVSVQTQLALPQGTAAVSIAAGASHSIVVLNDPAHTLVTLGLNNSGQLGNGGTNSGTAPSTFILPPGIITQPLSQSVQNGNSATLFVVPASAGSLSYQWYFNETPLIGQNRDTLTLTSVSDTNEGSYRVRINELNGGSVMSNPATLTVTGDDNNGGGSVDSSDPWADYDYIALINKGAKLTSTLKVDKGVKLLKGTKAQYIWHYTDAQGGKYDTVTTKNTYTVKPTLYGSGIYSVTLRYINNAGETKTFEQPFGIVKLVAAPKIAKSDGIAGELVGTRTNVLNGVLQGDSMRFTVKLESGDGPLTYTWLLNGKPVDVPRTRNALTDSYTAVNIQANSKYSVRVESANGANGKPLAKVTSKAVSVKVIIPPKVVSVSPAQTVQEGDTLKLEVKAAGTAKLTYAWYKNESLNPIYGATKSTLVVKRTTPDDAGTYRVEISNDAGSGNIARATVSVVVLGKNGARYEGSDTAQGAQATRLVSASIGGIGLQFDGSATALSGTVGISSAKGAQFENLSYLAPAVLSPGAVLRFDDGADALEILSATEIRGGTYAYERLTATTARLTYLLFTEADEIKADEILLVFSETTLGSYTLISDDDSASETGTFLLELPEE
jgi:alpha-tubulin suppressor-like RCC1 family protein